MLIFKKEKQVVDLVRQHVAAIDECLKKARETLEAYVDGNREAVRALAAEVSELESVADGFKIEIRDVLYSGAYLPNIRADMYRLADSLDSVAGKAEDCAHFLDCQAPIIPEEFQAEFLEILTISIACFYELTRAMKTFLKPKGKFEKLQERVNRVALLESEVDDKEVAMMRQIFASDLDLPVKIHLAKFLDMAALISDITENTADQLVFTALKSRI